MAKDGESIETSDEKPSNLPVRLEPMMLAHLALTGDGKAYKSWRERVEAIQHQRDVDLAPDSECREILEDRDAWLQMKTTGRLGSAFGMGLALLMMSTFLPIYAVTYQVGLLALLLLLPLPFAWRLGILLWEDAALGGMKDVGKKPTLKRRMRALGRAILRGFGAGFGFGFTLVFMQLLLTWFITPAPTLMAELAADTLDATRAGTVFGAFGMLLAPLISRGTPAVEEEEARVIEGLDRASLPPGGD